MKGLSEKKLNALTAIILILIIGGVIAVCFIPSEVVAINGGKEYSPIYSGNRDGDGVALTFNVYEGAEVVEGILDVLKEKNAKATFFLGGCWADDNLDVVRRIVDEGHEIGSHGYFHKDHAKLDEDENRAEMLLLDDLISRNFGLRIRYFAPPSGSFSQTTLKVALSLGYKTIMWSKDTIDWRDTSQSVVFSRATKNVAAGDIILAHPKKHTLAALPKILDYYQSKGLKAETIGEIIK